MINQPDQTLAPIALFAFNRPRHTRDTLEALAAGQLAPSSKLYVFIDGPKTQEGQYVTKSVFDTVASFSTGFAKVTIVVRDRNYGLSANIIAGVTDIVCTHGRIIVLEDDIVVSPFFLEYMNWSLDALADKRRVGSIHGYCYPDITLAEPYYYIKGGDCWGWATWRDRWALFESNGRLLLRRILARGRLLEFTMGGLAPYCRLLCSQILGRNNSWAIRWHASLFLADRLTLYPRHSLVKNIGFDGSGEHCDDSRIYDTPLVDTEETLSKVLPPLEPSRIVEPQFARNFAGTSGEISLLARRLIGMLSDLFWIACVALKA